MRTLLIVDDQASVRITLQYTLGLAGYRTLGADSGATALAAAENEQIDGALIDVHMPVMNGFDTTRRLREQATARGRELRVWLMTGAPNGAVERRRIELGALGLFDKPFDHDDLLARLERGFSAPLPPLPAETPPASAEPHVP